MAFECPERFESMRGRGSVRTCEACRCKVTDLSALSEAQARAVLRAGGCVSFIRNDAGDIVFERRSLRVLQPLAIAASLAAAACNSDPAPEALLVTVAPVAAPPPVTVPAPIPSSATSAPASPPVTTTTAPTKPRRRAPPPHPPRYPRTAGVVMAFD
jgi:hypothetical protein